MKSLFINPSSLFELGILVYHPPCFHKELGNLIYLLIFVVPFNMNWCFMSLYVRVTGFLTNEDTSVLEESLTSSYQVVNF
jgi:hypothetical protein